MFYGGDSPPDANIGQSNQIAANQQQRNENARSAGEFQKRMAEMKRQREERRVVGEANKKRIDEWRIANAPHLQTMSVIASNRKALNQRVAAEAMRAEGQQRRINAMAAMSANMNRNAGRTPQTRRRSRRNTRRSSRRNTRRRN